MHDFLLESILNFSPFQWGLSLFTQIFKIFFSLNHNDVKSTIDSKKVFQHEDIYIPLGGQTHNSLSYTHCTRGHRNFKMISKLMWNFLKTSSGCQASSQNCVTKTDLVKTPLCSSESRCTGSLGECLLKKEGAFSRDELKHRPRLWSCAMS